MKKSLTSPDIRELVSDWQYLVGSRVDQVGRPDSNKLIFKLRNRERGTIRLVIDLDGWAYLTKESLTTESNQGAFVNQIRKKIKKSRLDSITQLDGDRIISFEFSRKDDKFSLIFEFFHKGNAILCLDNQIEMVMRQTQYTYEEAAEKLEECNNDYMKVIRGFMGINKVEDKTVKSINQHVYKEIRGFMDCLLYTSPSPRD